jgi:FSR family fosmidomycin resistance protein-like MFS transporter
MAVVFIPLSGIAGSYGMLMLFIALGSVGSSLFHPSVAGMIPLYSGNRKGFSMSVFNTGGTLAFAVGPFFITAVVAAWGLAAMPATMAIGLAVMVYLWVAVPVPKKRRHGILGIDRHPEETVRRRVEIHLSDLAGDGAAGGGRPVVHDLHARPAGESGILPGLRRPHDHPVHPGRHRSAAWWPAIWPTGQGARPIFLVSHLLMTPALLVMLSLSGSWIYGGVFMAGFFVLATLPLGVTLAQELAPGGRSMVSSLMMGLAYGLGGCDGAGRRKTGRSLFDRHRAVGRRLHPPGHHSVNFILPKRKPDGSGLNPGKECQ